MTMAEPVYSLKHFLQLVEDLDRPEARPYSFYAVLLYAPMNGLDARLHEYMTSHWRLMDAMTGPNWLLLAVEDIQRAKPAIEDFKPEDIYHIARALGQSPNVIPCLVFFVNPRHQNDVITLKLDELFDVSSLPTDNELTDFFRSMASIIDNCAVELPEKRLKCLDKRIDKEWPEDSVWGERVGKATGWVVTSTATAATIAASLTPVIQSLSRVFGGV